LILVLGFKINHSSHLFTFRFTPLVNAVPARHRKYKIPSCSLTTAPVAPFKS
jgi:hypothetical protein